jgi:hypothetical protein
MGRTISDEELDKVIKAHDIDKSGELNFDEFKLVFASDEDIKAAKKAKDPVISAQAKPVEESKKPEVNGEKKPVRRTSLLLNMPLISEKEEKALLNEEDKSKKPRRKRTDRAKEPKAKSKTRSKSKNKSSL